MKIKKAKSKKPLITSLVILFLLVLALGAYVFYLKSQNQNSDNSETSTQVNLDPPTNEQKQAGDKIKKDSINNEGTTSPENVVNVSITAANQNNSSLQVRTLIDTVTSTGKCTLTLKKDSVTITKEAGVQSLSSSSTCTGFDIPTAELSEGSWQLTIDFKNDNLKGTVSRSIDIE